MLSEKCNACPKPMDGVVSGLRANCLSQDSVYAETADAARCCSEFWENSYQ
jgi:hypothetical protein